MNMNVSDWFGLLTTAFAIGALVGSLFRNASVKVRLTIAAVVTLASTIPLPFDTRPSLTMVFSSGASAMRCGCRRNSP